VAPPKPTCVTVDLNCDLIPGGCRPKLVISGMLI
jgi:hypothetical protein